MAAGGKPYLLLVPGLLNDARLWRHQVEHLADITEPVVADVTGSGSIALLASEALARVPAHRFINYGSGSQPR